MSSASTINEHAINTSNDYSSSISNRPMTFEEKAAIFKQKTGEHIDKSTPFVLSKESQVRFGFWGEFFRASVHAATNEIDPLFSIAEKYAALRAEIKECFKDDADEMYRQLGELNTALETALHNTSIDGMQTREINAFYEDLINKIDNDIHAICLMYAEKPLIDGFEYQYVEINEAGERILVTVYPKETHKRKLGHITDAIPVG